MSTTQRIIKYGAIAFAIFLIISIVTGILSLVINIGESFFGPSSKMDEVKILDERKELESEELVLDLKATNLTIKSGDTFKIETDNSKIEVNKDDKQIKIKDRSRSLNIGKNNETKIIVTIPANYEFKKIDLNGGAGKIIIEDLRAENMDIDLGAGSVSMKNIIATKSFDLDGGAGSIEIKNAKLHNNDIDLGVGSFKISGELTGDTEIDCGVGETVIELDGSKEEYKIHAEKGIGSIKIDDTNVSDNTTIGDGINYIDIDGGVGSIKISFKR